MKKLFLAAAFAIPNPTLTPGDTVTVATKTLCQHGYTSTVRSVPDSVKREVFKRYQMIDTPGAYEVDHWISLEIGGGNAVTNLWPQPWPEARKKDVVENWLHKQACSGKNTLQEVQRLIPLWESIYLSLTQVK